MKTNFILWIKETISLPVTKKLLFSYSTLYGNQQISLLASQSSLKNHSSCSILSMFLIKYRRCSYEGWYYKITKHTVVKSQKFYSTQVGSQTIILSVETKLAPASLLNLLLLSFHTVTLSRAYAFFGKSSCVLLYISFLTVPKFRSVFSCCKRVSIM